VKEFAGNEDVEFADVNLQDGRSGYDKQSPGAGGWPTIRYFNKKTGYDGAAYEQKTDKAICDELGKAKNMRLYVEEYGNTVRCNPKNLDNCTDSEKEYVVKWSSKTEDERTVEATKLQKKVKNRKRVTLLEKMKGMEGPPPDTKEL